ncbi:MAG: HD domain-containing protein [Patescibacteria group bacterium]|nr:HD domain-containing protein [Patescibacteria group bacterium]
MPAHESIQKLLDLQNAYSGVYRAIITSERLRHAGPDIESIDLKEERLREPLLEHVGHLPVIASFLHPHIERSKEVDLGRALAMLSIHDIGETVVGDVMAYHKSDSDTEKENKIVAGLLPDSLLDLFREYEARETQDAKFAKAVDAMAPFLHEINSSKLTQARFKAYGFGSKDIEAKKRDLFQWDLVLKEMFDEFLAAFKAIEAGQPSGFKGSMDIS